MAIGGFFSETIGENMKLQEELEELRQQLRNKLAKLRVLRGETIKLEAEILEIRGDYFRDGLIEEKKKEIAIEKRAKEFDTLPLVDWIKVPLGYEQARITRVTPKRVYFKSSSESPEVYTSRSDGLMYRGKDYKIDVKKCIKKASV